MSKCARAWISILLVIPSAIWCGFALSVLWGWFVSPLGVLEIGAIQAAGMAMIVQLLRVKATDETVDLGLSITYAIVAPALSLAFGWVLHVMMRIGAA